MSKSLQAFMTPLVAENQEILVSKRFKDENGKPVLWEIKPISTEENDKIMKKHMKRDKKGLEVFNRLDYINELVASAVVFPDLTDAALQKAWGVLGETQLLGKMLYTGEFSTLSEEVQKISGLDIDEENLIDEAKN